MYAELIPKTGGTKVKTKEKIAVKIHNGLDFEDQLKIVLFCLAEGIDEVKDLINIQMAGSRTESLGDKKAKALMIVIEKIIGRYQRNIDKAVGCYTDEEIFKLFEKAKIISRAENETEFQAAIADL